MQISISASGSKAQARSTVAAQTKQARTANPAHATAIAALGDSIQRQITAAKDTDTVQLSAHCSIAVVVTPRAEPAAEAKADAPADAKAESK